jgi:hypothetical protein
MKQTEVHQLVLEVVRGVARGRPVTRDTEFSQIGIGPWQRQRFFGPLRDAFNHHGVDITGGGVTSETFTHYQTMREVQAAVWTNVRGGQTVGHRTRAKAKTTGSNNLAMDAIS